MATESSAEFGKWRSFFWPVHRTELRKFIPMLLMFFLIAFNYNILKAFKDSLVVTAKDSGAEAIPFIKVWAILPAAILFTFIFTRVSNRFNREKVFYVMMAIFLSFFFVFTFILFPLREYLHPHGLADQLQSILPAGFKGLIAIFRNWTFTAFYVMSELWSTAILTVLFWGFANEVTNVEEAKRFYGILATGANLASILSGQFSILCSGDLFLSFVPYGQASWEQSVLFLNGAVLTAGAITILLFRWLNKHVLRPQEKKLNAPEPQKIKMSMRKNFSYLAQSKYLLYIALIVLTYNIAINLIEIVWKNEIKHLYPDPNSYNAYMGQVLTATGVIATVISVLLTTNILRRFSWTVGALIPAVIMLVTGGLFFAFVLFPQSPLAACAILFGATPLFMSVTFGSIQNCLTRACKFTLFDATKELAFIPLDKESKLKGKAAIDGVGSRLGKSGGSVIHQGLLMVFATVAGSSPYVAAVFLVVVVVWVFSVVALGKQFDELAARHAKISLEEKEPALS